MRQMHIEWPELGVSVLADLADAENPELCDELWRQLPFSVTQEHPVVSGSSITCWTTYLSKAPVNVRESIVDAPIGRLRFSQATGSKISIQYGPGLEPAMQAVLGQVVDEDVSLLPSVGQAVWSNLVWDKRTITVRYSKAGGSDDGTAPSPAAADPLAEEIDAAAVAYAVSEPPDITAIRTGQVADAGSFDQYFSVLDASNGLARDFTVNTLYPIYRVMTTHSLSSVRDMYLVVAANYEFTLRFHGYVELAGFIAAVAERLETGADAEVTEQLLEALLRYGNRMYSWSHHIFPWYLVRFFPKPGRDNYSAGTWLDPTGRRVPTRWPRRESMPARMVRSAGHQSVERTEINAEGRARELGLDLDDVPEPPGRYVAAYVVGAHCASAGHLPLQDGGLVVTGRVGVEVDEVRAAEAAAVAARNCLASIRREIGSLDRIQRVTRVSGYVNAPPEFEQHHLVTNGASDLIWEVFGPEIGRHVRCSVGVSGLPFGAPVEIDIECML